jgi:1-acyl-sn-glycerol-3-phosphate acyltransferase
MIQNLRSLLFDAFFYSFSLIYLGLFMPFMLVLPVGFCKTLFSVWGAIVMGALRFIVGLKYTVKDRHFLDTTLQQGPCILACKHQSAWETIIFSQILRDFRIVLKKELLSVPIFGRYLKKLNSISIDRTAGSKALKTLMEQSQQSINTSHSILIFPEGTRGKPGIQGSYQPGIGVLYKNLQVPVVPVALNSGVFWGRRSFFKKPGTIVLQFLPPIMPGLERDVFMKTLGNEIEAACNLLENQ